MCEPEEYLSDFDSDEYNEYSLPGSSRSSSPPRDFNIPIDAQYMPILDQSDIKQDTDIDNHDMILTTPGSIDLKSCPLNACPSCKKPLVTYYCPACVKAGCSTIINSPFKNSDDEIDKLRMIRLKKFQSMIDREPNPPEEGSERLLFRLRTLKRRVNQLKVALLDKKAELHATKQEIDETSVKVNVLKKSNISIDNKIQLIKKYITSRQSSIKKRERASTQLNEDLKQHVTRRVFQLNHDVFPIESINLLDQNNYVNLETSPLLTFSDGSEHQFENQTAYSILEPWLPSNGDYSAYSLWVNDNKDHISASVSELSERNAAFRIGAGLAFTSQFVINLSHYLDVILPATVGLETFNRQPLDDIQFSFNVAKLNLNVLHLCISQGIDIALLNPNKTLKNLTLLLNINLCDLGRKSIIDIDNEEAAIKIENELDPPLSSIQDELYDFSKCPDETSDSDSEWEISESITSSEVQAASEQQQLQVNSFIANLPMRLFSSFWGN